MYMFLPRLQSPNLCRSEGMTAHFNVHAPSLGWLCSLCSWRRALQVQSQQTKHHPHVYTVCRHPFMLLSPSTVCKLLPPSRSPADTSNTIIFSIISKPASLVFSHVVPFTGLNLSHQTSTIPKPLPSPILRYISQPSLGVLSPFCLRMPRILYVKCYIVSSPYICKDPHSHYFSSDCSHSPALKREPARTLPEPKSRQLSFSSTLHLRFPRWASSFLTSFIKTDVVFHSISFYLSAQYSFKASGFSVLRFFLVNIKLSALYIELWVWPSSPLISSVALIVSVVTICKCQ